MNLTIQQIQGAILTLPGRPPFMLSKPLAGIYETETKQIAQAVRRHPERFPEDFCFELTDDEIGRLQIEAHISDQRFGKTIAFTRNGANMLSSVLRTPVAAARSVQIMRAFSEMEEQHFSMPTAQQLALAQEVGQLNDRITDLQAQAQRRETEHGRQICNLQEQMIVVMQSHLGTSGKLARLLVRQENEAKRRRAAERNELCRRLLRENRPRAEIIAETGLTSNHVRQIARKLRAAGESIPDAPSGTRLHPGAESLALF